MEQIPAWFVVVMGIGTVFVGLICIIVLCTILGLVFSRKNAKMKQDTSTVPASGNQGEILAAIAAAIAKESGVDPAGVRILSVKKV